MTFSNVETCHSTFIIPFLFYKSKNERISTNMFRFFVFPAKLTLMLIPRNLDYRIEVNFIRAPLILAVLCISGGRSQLVNSLRQSVLQLENSIPLAFMHVNWSQLRKLWITAVNACNTPRDFARAMIALHACIKPVVFASVWHEQLGKTITLEIDNQLGCSLSNVGFSGHTKLLRITAAEREEKKRTDKKEKKDMAEEEERHRMTYNFVKYTLGLKHQVSKSYSSQGRCIRLR